MVNFTRNTYTDVAMGVGNLVDGTLIAGCLHKLVGAFMADFSDENYTNIGAYN